MNITARRTPGSWLTGPGTRRVIDGRGIVIAQAITSEWITTPEAIANARLIAKAPDMLAALRIALAYLEEHPYINHAGVKCEPSICARLRRVIEED